MRKLRRPLLIGCGAALLLALAAGRGGYWSGRAPTLRRVEPGALQVYDGDTYGL